MSLKCVLFQSHPFCPSISQQILFYELQDQNQNLEHAMPDRTAISFLIDLNLSLSLTHTFISSLSNTLVNSTQLRDSVSVVSVSVSNPLNPYIPSQTHLLPLMLFVCPSVRSCLPACLRASLTQFLFLSQSTEYGAYSQSGF